MAKQSIKYLYPFPVFEGHFDDGSVLRMSFYSPAGKPVDSDRGAHVVTETQTSVGYGQFVRIDGRWRQPALRNERKLVSGFVEHPSIGRIPYEAGQAVIKAPKRTNATLLAVRAILAQYANDHAGAVAALQAIAA